MIDISAFMDNFLDVLNDNFGNRVWFVGLQGSYARGEATDTSDIDIVVILDELSAMDIQTYRGMLDALSHRKLICGFLAGKKELFNWDPSDLFQFYHDISPIKGTLDELLPLIDKASIQKAIKIGVCNIHHGCVHNMVHTRNDKTLSNLYKTASFVVQAIHFLQTGSYIRHQKDLLQAVSQDEQLIVDTFLNIKNGGEIDFQKLSEILFSWSKKWINKT